MFVGPRASPVVCCYYYCYCYCCCHLGVLSGSIPRLSPSSFVIPCWVRCRGRGAWEERGEGVGWRVENPEKETRWEGSHDVVKGEGIEPDDVKS